MFSRTPYTAHARSSVNQEAPSPLGTWHAPSTRMIVPEPTQKEQKHAVQAALAQHQPASMVSQRDSTPPLPRFCAAAYFHIFGNRHTNHRSRAVLVETLAPSRNHLGTGKRGLLVLSQPEWSGKKNLLRLELMIIVALVLTCSAKRSVCITHFASSDRDAHANTTGSFARSHSHTFERSKDCAASCNRRIGRPQLGNLRPASGVLVKLA